MEIKNIYNAAIYGYFDEFKQYFDGDINYIDKFNGKSLLQLVMLDGDRYKDRLEIISFLINEGIDVNFVDRKNKQNALHDLYSATFFKNDVTDGEYVLTVTKMLMDAGIDINCKNKAGSIPLAALIAGKLKVEDMKPIIQVLLDAGADYLHKNKYGESCLDYANKFGREEVVKMLEERK